MPNKKLERTIEKAKAFLGCSSENLKVAEYFQEQLGEVATLIRWNAGVFKPGDYTLERLIHDVEKFDFGIFVISPDDTALIRGKRVVTSRDNVIFEAGLFFGKLDRQRTVIIVPKGGGKDVHLPSDLAGLNLVFYSVSDDTDELRANISTACIEIKRTIEHYGPRSESKASIKTYTSKSSLVRFTSSREHETILTNYVLSQSKPKDTFYASVGEADSFYPWIERLFNDCNINPPIKEIVVKRLSSELASDLQSSGYVKTGFVVNLERYFAALLENERLKQAKVKITVLYWNSLPRFQGYLFKGKGFTNHWQINKSGFLDAKTPLEMYDQSDLSERYAEELKSFRSI